MEGFVITTLVILFIFNFDASKNTEALGLNGHSAVPGLFLMGGYILLDSFTSNSEDVIYQRYNMDPGQVLLGMQMCSGVIAWISVLLSGHLGPAFLFLFEHPRSLTPLTVLVMAEACGAYACTVTVRLFGPAVFTLLLTCHQLLALIVSVLLFQHVVSWANCLCLAVVALIILTSSARRVYVSPTAARLDELVGK